MAIRVQPGRPSKNGTTPQHNTHRARLYTPPPLFCIFPCARHPGHCHLVTAPSAHQTTYNALSARRSPSHVCLAAGVPVRLYIVKEPSRLTDNVNPLEDQPEVELQDAAANRVEYPQATSVAVKAYAIPCLGWDAWAAVSTFNSGLFMFRYDGVRCAFRTGRVSWAMATEGGRGGGHLNGPIVEAGPHLTGPIAPEASLSPSLPPRLRAVLRCRPVQPHAGIV